MSTIDWQELADRHERAPEIDDAQWSRALAAFDEDPAEHDAALASDPLLMFRDLPEVEISGTEIDAMKAAVASMRRAHAVEHVPQKDSRKSGHGFAALAERRTSWPIAALFAVAVTALALTGFDGNTPLSSAQDTLSAASAAQDAIDFDLATHRVPAELQLKLASMPLVEEADPTKNLMMQIEDPVLTLIVVDPGFDDFLDFDA